MEITDNNLKKRTGSSPFDKEEKLFTSASLRKIEFDRGIPLSFDFKSNEVVTYDYRIHFIILRVLSKILLRPLYLMTISLYILYLISIATELNNQMKNNYVLFVIHIVGTVIEIFFEFWHYYEAYRNDKKINSQTAYIYDEEQKCFVETKWKNIRVGHIIKVQKDEIVPADIVILETMDSNHQCYIDISSINGVFDQFSIKNACTDTQTPSLKSVKFTEYVKSIKGMMKCDEPNSDLYTFSGRLKLESFPRASDITEENFIMRGSSIKNVKCLYGMVIYTGMETKIMQILNSKKNNSIIKNDRNIIYKTFIFIHYLLIGILVIFSIMFSLQLVNKKFYLRDYQNKFFISPSRDIYYGIYEFILIFQLYIPNIWYNLIFIAYYILALFIKWDVKIRQKSKYIVDIINTNCLSDFGNVKYILTDKTGTLTSRKFILKACSIRGKLYSFDPLDRKDDNYIFRMKNSDITDLELYQDLNSNSSASQNINSFFEYLTLCQSVKIKMGVKGKENEKTYGYTFAEEKAMLKAFEKFGYFLSKIKNDKIIIESKGTRKAFYVVGNNSYTKSRNRMSKILKKSRNDNESFLICKGYDISIFNVIKRENDIEHSLMKDQIHKLSSIGYRFVVFCKKLLDEEETSSFMTKYKLAENYALEREYLFENLALEYENNLELLGILFFEEKISSDLRYSIAKLNNSGIYVWVVSGDKKENVISVANNLEMIKSTMNIVEFSEKDDIDDLDIKMNLALHQLINKNFRESGMIKMFTRSGKGINVDTKNTRTQEICIIISGPCFNIICMDTRLYQCFSILLSFASSLFAYQFNINNKYQLCKLIKNYVTLNSKVLAIGDGLNDFMMLKEADLSIGIYSREIFQVRNTCDIIVTKFSQIVDLILVHGSWNLHRLIKISFFSIYSNVLIIFPIFVYQSEITIDSAFFYLNRWQLVLKLLIINLSILLIISFDHYVERPLIGINTMLYNENFIEKGDYYKMFIKVSVKGIIDAIIIIYNVMLNCRTNINIIGETIDINIFAETIFITSFIIIFLELYVYCLHSINLVMVLINLLAIGAIIAVYFIDEDVCISMYHGLSFLNVVLVSFLGFSFCYIYSFSYESFKYNFYPNYLQNLGKIFKKFIQDYMLFLNFEDNIKNLSHLVKNAKPKNKISYIGVIENLNNQKNVLDSIIDNITDVNNEKISSMKIKKPSLEYIDAKLEKDYTIHKSSIMINSFKAYQISTLIFWLIDLVIEGIKGNLKDEIISKTLKFISFVTSFVLYRPKLRENFLSNYHYYYYFSLVIEIICIYIEKQENDVKICLQIIVLFSYPILIANTQFYPVVTGLVFYYISVFPAVVFNDFGFTKSDTIPFILEENLCLIYHRALNLLIIFTIFILYGYNEELDSKISFIKFHKKVLDLKKDGEIFNNLVPEFIQGRMKNSSERNTVEYETVTIVFCDISDFDKLVAKLTAKDMIYLLDKIYGTFDQLCNLHGIQKIETVGKTYMACGGLRECEKDIDNTILSKHHAVRIFEMAIDMVDIMQSMTLENGEIVRVKIGVHTGKVIPAVVGNHKPQFSLIGDTVNTSARMCSYSKDLCIMCSDDAYQHIGKVYTEFIHSEQIVKGKGEMQLHLYNPIKSKINIFETKVKNIKESQWLIKSNTLRHQNSIKNNPPIINNLTGKNNEPINIIELKKDNENNVKINVSQDSGSNRSVFIYEDSLEIPEKPNRSSVKKISNEKMIIAKKLSKRMTTLNSGSIISKQQNTERNFIYHDSYFFLDFKSKTIDENEKNEQEKEKHLSNLPREVYDRYLKLKFKKKENYTNLIHIIYIICILIGIYNLSSYNYILSYFFIFNVIRFIIVLGVIITLTFSRYLREHLFIYKTLVFFIYLSFTMMIQIQLNLVNQYFYLNLILEQHLTILITSFNGILCYKDIFIQSIIFIIIFAINLFVNIKSYLIVKYMIVSMLITLIIVLFLVIREYISTSDYIMNKQKNDYLQSFEDLLFNLMPPHVVQNLKEDIPVADVINNVTMLFADIVKFTDFSAAREPYQVVDMLKELFKRFDDTCKSTNCYKVHTIGDCYVVMSFTGKIPMHERNYVEEARNVVKMGEKMIEIIKEVRSIVDFEALNMRIGIHTGTVIAGIIGSKIVRYDIFGSDVLIANKMESSGCVGRINISEDTKKLLESDQNNLVINFEPNTTVHIPSLSKEVNSYLIKEHIEEDNIL